MLKNKKLFLVYLKNGMVELVKKNNEKEIKVYRDRQMQDIWELRNVMQGILQNSDSETILCVGEGVHWNVTWTAHCINNNSLPKTIKLIVMLDLYGRDNSIFRLPDLWKNKNYIILPIIGNATNLQFSSNYFDMVAAPLMIDDCLDHQKLISELFRCTKKNGIVMISGHGIDLVGKLSKIPSLLGAGHKNPVSPPMLDKYISTNFNAEEIKRWRNNHAWIRVYKKLYSDLIS